jgi:hypothetical protein
MLDIKQSAPLRVLSAIATGIVVLALLIGGSVLAVKHMKNSSSITLQHSRLKHPLIPPSLPQGFRFTPSDLKPSARRIHTQMKVGQTPFPTPERQFLFMSN